MKRTIIIMLAVVSIAHGQATEAKLYTIAHVSIITDTGVIGFPIGTEVVKISEGKYQIGKQTVEIDRFKVSSDLATVADALSRDASNQTRLAEIRKRQQEQERDRITLEAQQAADSIAKVIEARQQTFPVSQLQTSGALGATVTKKSN